MERFWVYLDNKVQGPVEIPGLRKLTGFNLLTQVCSEGQENWRMADEVIEIKAYFAAPPRGSSLIPENQPEFSAGRNQMEMPLPGSPAASDMRPFPAGQGPIPGQRVQAEIETLEDAPVAVAGTSIPQPEAAPGALRVSCVTCGYKNPRDVAGCMKCGAPLKPAAAPAGEKPPMSLSALADSPAPVKTAISLNEAPAEIPGAPPAKLDSPMVEIPVARIAIILASVVLAGAIVFTVRHMWKGKPHHKKSAQTVVVEKAAPAAKSSSRKGGRVKPASLPGVAANPPAPSATRQDVKRSADEPETKAEEKPAAKAEAAESSYEKPASYNVVDQAYPMKHRMPSPVDSPYAIKRRGDRGLWSGKEAEAIRRVQSQRLYGGIRTVQRNVEILMQILRDREYSAAFESGKRPYLFNDVDWAAAPKEGPMQEVRLTFSGGREADGAPREPLRFAFNVDLERQTVQPGGSGQIKANTMHAFFDESRIPPEDRRSIAKDTEDLVRAAQPGASPLTLDTLAKKYTATYSFAAITRVANAYNLTLVNKKLARETASINEILPDLKETTTAKPETAAGPKEKVKLSASESGSIRYTMERGQGKERLVTALAPSKATPAKLWEAMTAYDRLTQYVPDLLVSQREGQDGAAVIVHMVSLTRLMFFVFKVNLHLRILEHPKQHRLEFERIAGDFEKFSGYIEMTPDATGTRSKIDLHLALVPKGYTPDWALRGMAEHFVVPVLDAIRAKAEAY